MKRQLLIGCGASRQKLFNSQEQWGDLTTLDSNANHEPDIIWDLRVPLSQRFKADWFDEIHAYDVLEHVNYQGDYKAFFAEFEGYWTVLKPGGMLFGVTPAWNSFWAWSDPSHRRVISEGSLVFLSQKHYDEVGKTPTSDYRNIYKGDLRLVHYQYKDRIGNPPESSFYFALQALKG
jgi:hypothetical protein